MPTRRFWTKDEEEKLIHYYNKGLSYKEIASLLNRTKDAVRMKIIQLKNREIIKHITKNFASKSINLKCPICGKPIYPKIIKRIRTSSSGRKIICREKYIPKYCSPKCRYYALSKKLKGRKMPIETRQKLSKIRKQLIAEGKIVINQEKNETFEHIIKMIKIRGKVDIDDNCIEYYGEYPKIRHHKQALPLARKILENKGYRCIDITKKPLPDLIAIKNEKIYAVEVHKCWFNKKKYSGKNDYDDVIWLFFGRGKRGHIYSIKGSGIRPRPRPKTRI